MKNHAKKFIITGLFITFSVLSMLVFFYIVWYSQPLRNGELKVSGLKEEVSIYFDYYGRPHVYANNLHDLVFTQGYLTAQDRLFQLDITRRAARGELSEIFGKKGLVRDTFVRDIGLVRIAKKEWIHASKESKEILDSYSKGITAYIEKHKHNLPIEFKLLNYKPKPWKGIDSLLVVKQIAEVTDTSWQLDLVRQEVYKKIPVEKAETLFEQSFPINPIINYDAQKYLVFDEYTLKKPNLIQKWKNLKQKVVLKKMLEVPYIKIKRKIIEAADFLRNGTDRWDGFNWGSNCWVIGNIKSKIPILANDPHMELANPSFWYPIHLISKENNINALGLSIPGIPGILIGHNSKIAWGITSLSADVQDLFVGEFEDEKLFTYKSNGNLERAKVIRSKIKVKNKRKPYIHKTILTKCGPLLDTDDKKAVVLKWALAESKNHDSVSSIWNLAKASNWNEFRNTLKKYNGSTLSFHYVDKEGNTGYQATGVIPHRKFDSGNTPLSGFSCNEHWSGTIPFENLPHSFNPNVGYIVSANNKVISTEYNLHLGNNFLSPFRAARISTLLSESKKLDLEENKKIQKDDYSWIAHYLTLEILEAYYKTKTTNKELLPVVQMLSKWDFKLTPDSTEALIFEKTYENIFKKILISKLGKVLASDYIKEWRASSLAFIKILTDEDSYWLPEGIKNYESLLLISLSDGIKEIKKSTGTSDINKWQWGKYHKLIIEHPFSKALPLLSPFTNIGPIKVGGNKDTISAFGKNNNSKIVWGPSARVVIDLSDINNAHIQIPLGTSSQVGSPYYKDQTKGWVENSGVPFAYSDDLVKVNKKELLVLKPKI